MGRLWTAAAALVAWANVATQALTIDMGEGSLADAVTTTLAGGGGSKACSVSGYKDGLAASALFDLPARLQVLSMPKGADPSGATERLYVFDIHNGCVRSLPLGLSQSQTVVRSDTQCGAGSTLAHIGPDAHLPNGTSRHWRWIDGPLSFRVSADAGKIWVMDTYNNQLKVATRTAGSYGPFTVVAGSGETGTADGDAKVASFYQAHGMDVAESRGMAFVADTFQSCLRSVDLATGRVATIAGTCGQGGHRDVPPGGDPRNGRFNHVHHVAVDPRNDSILYVSEAECSDDGPLNLADPCKASAAGVFFAGVRRIVLKPDNTVASVSTAAGAEGDVGFADGSVTTAKFHYVHQIAMQPGTPGAGSTVLVVMDDNNQRVRQVDLAAGTVRTLAGSGASGCADGASRQATFSKNGAVGVAVDLGGSVYVADYANNRIRKIAFAPPGPPPRPPAGTVGNGTCGPTAYGKDCNADPKGSFPGMKTLEACVEKLQGCKMANYASWSLGWNDCSWYSECDWSHLCADCTKPGPNCPNPATGGCPVYHPFTSEILRAPGPAPPPVPPPPSPPPGPPEPPVGTVGNGTCGPTSYGGSCDTNPKGSFPGIKTLEDCVAKVKGCKMGNFASFSLEWNDCSWYSECDWNHLCADCSQPGPNCPGGTNPASGAAGGHCPHYGAFASEVIHVGPPSPTPPPTPEVVTVTVDWTSPIITTNTAATVEVDVMPFLGEADWGGPYQAYHTALSKLGSEYVRFAPWFANPRVVVPELTPHDCDATHPSTNWNSTYFDQVMADFQSAVCGPEAAKGICKLSVVQQLSTMPAWMYVGGYEKPLPSYPWNTTDPFDAYGAGHALNDTSCGQMARYFGRLVGWYTAGGFHDECGHFHPSKFHYNWYGLSVLNEDEHQIHPENGVAYTTCYDAIKVEVEKVNPNITLVGPEIVGGSWSWPYMKFFLNASNHADKKAPPIASYHWFGGYISNNSGEAILQRWMHDVRDPNGIVLQTQAAIAASGQKTEVVLNEFIPFLSDWCNCTGNEHLCGGKALPGNNCPNYQLVATGGGQHDSTLKKGIGANRATWSWNSAAAVFALGFATLAELGYKYVGADQLVGGVWPDNEPAVSCLDWQTGEPNAKYYAITALTSSVGTSAAKTIFKSNITVTGGPGAFAAAVAGLADGTSAPLSGEVVRNGAGWRQVNAPRHAQFIALNSATPVGTLGNGTCGPTAYGKDCNADPKGSFPGMKTLEACVEKLQGCKMANYASWSLGWNDCSWYSECDWSHLCADCTKPGPNCPNPATGGCPVYHPFTSEILRAPGPAPPPGPPPPPPPPPPTPTPVHVMPYEMSGKKGMLIINMMQTAQHLKLTGVTGGSASSVEVATTGASAAEPGYAEAVQKTISKAGELVLGPFAVAVVTLA